MIEIKNLTKTYEMGNEIINAIDHINLKVEDGDYISIIGPSGSGKSTLMNILGLLDVATSGKYFLDDEDVSQVKDDHLSELRNKKIGFIFQDFNLLSKLTALDNVCVPLLYQGKTKKEARDIAKIYLNKMGLKNRLNHLPTELSGGQQQRVAIARALSCNPEIILADEPTGALDSKTSMELMDILEELNKEGQTIIIITHNDEVAKRARRVIKIKDGKLYEEGYHEIK